MVELANLIEPETLSTALAIVITGLFMLFAYFAVRLRHALLGIAWFTTVLVLGLIALVGLEFLWLWLMFTVMGAIVALAGLFRWLVIPSRTRAGERL